MNAICDQSQRQLAQDLTYSCVVRAPAGSGKTELLVQRTLRALLVVEQPEEVLLLTFTNKAVQELQHRVTLWLCSPCPPEKSLPETAQLAEAVKQRSRSKGWELELCPSRLQIFTLDAYFSHLYHLFNTEKNGQACQLLADPKSFYESILDTTLEQLFDDQEGAELLQIFQRPISGLRQLFLNLTLSRDRWLSTLYQKEQDSDLQQHLIKELGILEELTAAVATQRDTAAAFISQYDNTWPYSLSPSGLDYWRCWAQVLLTEKGAWRQSFRQQQGVPPLAQIHSWHNPQHRSEAVLALAELSACLQQSPIAYALLRLLRSCPKSLAPQMPQALASALKKWVALITMVKKEQRVADFIDLTLTVASFFHQPETSSQLEAFVDKKITHLLIDEIQDLSRVQFEIIKALLQNFCYRPEKSAFMVGDPQQAIYHFRGAHIGVFSDFEALSLDGLPKKNCLLQSNFRSSPELVTFVSSWAQQRFGAHSSQWLGIDKALNSQPVRHIKGQVRALLSPCPHTEAALLLSEIIKRQKNDPEKVIAVLARDRASLAPLMALLNRHHINYDAGDMLAYSQYAFFVDLKYLIAVILNPREKSYWLPLLRSTWLRASFDDIYQFFQQPKERFWDGGALDQYSLLFQQDYRMLQELECRFAPFKHRSPFGRFWDALWHHMGLPESLSAQEKNIWQTVALFMRAQDWQIDCATLLKEMVVFVDRLQQPPHLGSQKINLKLLTIHKAKGLEFDIVILPQLAAKLPTHERPFLLEVPIADHVFWALNAPEQSTWFDFFDGVLKQQQDHEFERLLYVAMTRAKQELLLSANEKKSHQRSFWSSLQGLLPKIEQEHPQVLPKTEPEVVVLRKKVPSVWPQWAMKNFQWNTDPLLWQEQKIYPDHERVIGLVLHHCLAYLTCRPWPKDLLTQENLERLWYRFGGGSDSWSWAFSIIGRALSRLEQSQALNPIFDRSHRQVFSEFSMMRRSQSVAHQCQKISVDRLIIDKTGRYWVVEWKTGAAWEAQWPQYREQILSYAQAVEEAFNTSSPVICLYILQIDKLYLFEKEEDFPMAYPG